MYDYCTTAVRSYKDYNRFCTALLPVLLISLSTPMLLGCVYDYNKDLLVLRPRLSSLRSSKPIHGTITSVGCLWKEAIPHFQIDNLIIHQNHRAQKLKL